METLFMKTRSMTLGTILKVTATMVAT